MNYNYILAIDPSGSYNEGKGTTGWCILDAERRDVSAVGALSAKDYESIQEYWKAHTDLMESMQRKYKNLVIVIEDYVLYANKATAQINSRMETCKLIGILEYACMIQLKAPLQTQLAASVKLRWADSILEFKGYLIKCGKSHKIKNGDVVNRHMKDAIRHAVHFATFNNMRR